MMAHDLTGKNFEVGDVVAIRFEVTEIEKGEGDDVRVCIKSLVPDLADEKHEHIWVRASICQLLEKPEPPADVKVPDGVKIVADDAEAPRS